MVKKDELLINELFEMAGKYNGRTSELFILAASNIQEKSKQIEKLEVLNKDESCTHKNINGFPTLEYDSVYEMRNSDMHCTLCGKSGSREELTK